MGETTPALAGTFGNSVLPQLTIGFAKEEVRRSSEPAPQFDSPSFDRDFARDMVRPKSQMPARRASQAVRKDLTQLGSAPESKNPNKQESAEVPRRSLRRSTPGTARADKETTPTMLIEQLLPTVQHPMTIETLLPTEVPGMAKNQTPLRTRVRQNAEKYDKKTIAKHSGFLKQCKSCPKANRNVRRTVGVK